MLLPIRRTVAHLRTVHVLWSTVLVHRWRELHLTHELLWNSAVRHGTALHAWRHLHGLHHTWLAALRHTLRLRLTARVLIRTTAVWLVDHAEGLLLWSWSRPGVGSGPRSRTWHWSSRSRTSLWSCHGHLSRMEGLRHGLWCLSARVHTRLDHASVARDEQTGAVVHDTTRRCEHEVLTVWLATESPHRTYRFRIGHLGHLKSVEILANVLAAGTRGGPFDDLVAEEWVGRRGCRSRGSGRCRGERGASRQRRSSGGVCGLPAAAAAAEGGAAAAAGVKLLEAPPGVKLAALGLKGLNELALALSLKDDVLTDDGRPPSAFTPAPFAALLPSALPLATAAEA